MNKKKVSSVFSAALVAVFTLSATASAHVVVRPGEVKTASFQTFTMGVPNEKGGDVVEVKLEIPEGLTSVRPSVKPGWKIDIEREGEGEDSVVSSITWSGGKIGDGLRDDFTFAARTPDEPTELQWNAFETYANSVTVAWNLSDDEQPTKEDGSPDFSTSGPYSVTNIVTETTDAEPVAATSTTSNTPLYISVVALMIALGTFAVSTRKK